MPDRTGAWPPTRTLAEIMVLDRRLNSSEQQLHQAVAAAGSTLIELYGMGPVGAARVLGDIRRFPSKHHFALGCLEGIRCPQGRVTDQAATERRTVSAASAWRPAGHARSSEPEMLSIRGMPAVVDFACGLGRWTEAGPTTPALASQPVVASK
jgi:hypothetical protein